MARERRGRESWAFGASAGALAAAVPALFFHDFTVDDALIPARYAAHLAAGLGYRFNATGAVTDGVTPLGFPYLLAPFASGGPLSALVAAKVIGALAWIAAAAVLGVAIDRASASPARFVGLGWIALSAPIAAWSVAGLETGVVTALATLAVAGGAFDRTWTALALAGLAAAWRPEMLPWALALAALPISGKSFARVAAVAVPFTLVALARVALFGRAVPLSALAKPTSEYLGFVYVAKCLLLTGVVLLAAPVALRKIAPWPRTVVVATVVHFAAVAVAGGDWMPLARLVVPVLPGAALAAAHLASASALWANLARGVLTAAGLVFQIVVAGPSAAHVGAERRALIRELRPALAGARSIAALDVGWLVAATGASIVDLAGLTDPAIAVLPGGHTSKQLPAGLLDTRDVDAIVLLLLDGHELETPWTASYFARFVELRVSEMPGVGDRFQVVATSVRPHLRYVVLRRR